MLSYTRVYTIFTFKEKRVDDEYKRATGALSEEICIILSLKNKAPL